MTLDDLLAEREICRKLAQFARAMDERNWRALDELTADDITADLGIGEIAGRDAVVEFMRTFLDECGTTQHLLGSILVDVDSHTATSRAYVSDLHVGTGENEGLTFRTLGDYHDDWKRIDGDWLIVRRVKKNRAALGSIEVLGPGPQS